MHLEMRYSYKFEKKKPTYVIRRGSAASTLQFKNLDDIRIFSIGILTDILSSMMHYYIEFGYDREYGFLREKY